MVIRVSRPYLRSWKKAFDSFMNTYQVLTTKSYFFCVIAHEFCARAITLIFIYIYIFFIDKLSYINAGVSFSDVVNKFTQAHTKFQNSYAYVPYVRLRNATLTKSREGSCRCHDGTCYDHP